MPRAAVLAIGLIAASWMAFGSAPYGENMRIRLEEISISVPEGFQPLIGVGFANEETRETVTIGQGTAPAGIAGTENLLFQRGDEFALKLGVTATREQVRSVTLLGRPAHQMVLTFNYEGNVMRVWWAVVFTEDTRFLQITYMTPNIKDSAAKFDRMVTTATFPDKTSGAVTTSGWINRYAGVIALDIPANLAPPHVYSFVSSSGQDNLTVKLYARNSNAGSPPTLAEETSSDTQSGELITERASNTFTVLGGTGARTSYVLTKKELTGDEVFVVHRAREVFKDGLVVVLEGRGPAANRAHLDAVFQQLVDSLEHSKR